MGSLADDSATKASFGSRSRPSIMNAILTLLFGEIWPNARAQNCSEPPLATPSLMELGSAFFAT